MNYVRINFVFLLGLSFLITGFHAQSGINTIRLLNHTVYIQEVIQEMVYELEDRSFSSLKLKPFYTETNLTLLGLQVVGSMHYENGFVQTVQDVYLLEDGRTQVINFAANTASVTGIFRLEDMDVAFDILATIENQADAHATGVYNYDYAEYRVTIEKNLINLDITARVDSLSLNARNFERMDIRPPSDILTILARQFVPTLIGESVRDWAEDYLQPLAESIANNIIDFPILCYDCTA